MMDPNTGQGFEAVEAESNEYFDPNATDPAYPGALGLQIKQRTYWQGDVVFNTFETLGPVMGLPWPQGTLIVSSSQAATDPAPQGVDASGNPLPIPGQTAAGFSQLPPGFGPGTADPSTEIPCDPDGIFGPMFGDSPAEIKILLQGVYGIGDLYFPVPPEELTGDFPQDNDGDTDTLAGEITIPGTEKLESIGWTSFFPRDYNDTYCVVPLDQMPDPMDAIVGLIWSKRLRLPLNLIITGTPWHDTVVIKTLKWTYKAGEPGDIYYDIQFKRYRSASVTSVALPNAPVDPRDYPTYQGPPPVATPYGPEPQYFLNPATNSYEVIRGIDASTAQVSDGTTSAVDPDPPSAPQTFLNPSTSNYEPITSQGATPGVFLVAPPPPPAPTKVILSEYTIGAAVNWRGTSLVSGQTFRQFYEDVKNKNSQNTFDALKELNKDASADNFPLALTVFATKHKVSEYDPNYEPLPLGTKLKYWNTVPNNLKLKPGETLTHSRVANAVMAP